MRASSARTHFLASLLAGAAVVPLGAEEGFVEEREPNASAAAATVLATAFVRARGHVFPAGDVDYWSFPASTGDRVYAATMTSAANPAAGSLLDVLGADGATLLESDDNNGSFGPTSSSVAGVVIPATGTYFLRVAADTAQQILPYHLYFQLRSGAPEPEVEPNNLLSPAALPVSGWVTGVTSAVSDVDAYAVDLRAGDVVFLSLDLDPERDDLEGPPPVPSTYWNGQVGLGRFDGVVLAADDFNAAGPDSEAFFMKVAAAGTYLVYVGAPVTAQNSGTYHLSVSVHPAADEGVNCTTYASEDVSLPIPSLGAVASAVSIPGHPRIADLDVSIRLDHPNMPDLDVHLVSPAGNDNGLFSDIGSSVFPAMDLTLDDEAGMPPLFPIMGDPIAYQPESAYRLSWFDGEDAGGTWSLVIRDDGAASDGTLTGWSLRVCEPPPPAPCPPGYGPVTVYTSDFESDGGGFTHSGTPGDWEWGTPSFPPMMTTCNSGAQCWATNLEGPYEANTAQDLLSPVIPLFATYAAPIVVSWAQRYQMEGAQADHYAVDVQEASGANPTRLFEWRDATMTDTVGNPAVTINESAGWGVVRRRIDGYAGQDVRLRFHLDSGPSFQYAGVFVDDVTVVACALSPDLIFKDGFE
jgi:hypothetical protein